MDFKKINFKSGKYIYPLIIVPGLIFLFWQYNRLVGNETDQVIIEKTDEIQSNIQDVSVDEKNKPIEDKLQAYEDKFISNRDREYSAMLEIGGNESDKVAFEDLYEDHEKRQLDSLQRVLQEQKENALRESTYSGYISPEENQQRELNKILGNKQPAEETTDAFSNDPIEMMRKQYAVLDSLENETNPERIAQRKEAERIKRLNDLREFEELSRLNVSKAHYNKNFNTIQREKQSEFIKAIIDEDKKGYAGSRIRIRLLENIKVGNFVINKGAFLFANITGFSAERVKLDVTSVMYANEILPIKLSIYDVDGMEGLYVPESQFREFTKELGAETVQGMNLSSATTETQQQFFTSLAERAFTSTSTAIAKMLRKNSAKLKYNTFVYLIDANTLDEKKKEIYEKNKITE